MSDPTAWTAAEAMRLVRMPTDADDKYSRGVVGLRTGSAEYPGAAVLGVEGAWHAGAGMVRYAGPAVEGVLARRPETVPGTGRVQAWVVGSGTDTSTTAADELAAVRSLLDGAVPVIVDAGALEAAVGARAPLILTPHAGEHARLRERLGLSTADQDDLHTRAVAVAETARTLGHAVLLKGACTLVAAPDGRVLAVEAATPWLSTAGTGDVLAGILGTLVASSVAVDPQATGDPARLAELGATAAWVHGAAGRVAAGQLDPEVADVAALDERAGSGHPITALEVAAAVPRVIGALLRLRGA